jgi:hypothetical protein
MLKLPFQPNHIFILLIAFFGIVLFVNSLRVVGLYEGLANKTTQSGKPVATSTTKYNF